MEILFIIIAILAGFLTGIITGLIPGLHVNTVAALMVGLAGVMFTLGIEPIAIAVFIVATAITHSFFDFVPTLFLGVPADETYALLPGQEMVREGRGLEALQLSIIGSWRGLLMGVSILVVLIFLNHASGGAVQGFERGLQPWMFWIMLVISLVLIVTEKKRLWAFIIFLCSGIYGLVVFNSPLVPGGTMSAFSVLFPALTGLFGVSGLLLSLFEKTSQISEQEKTFQLKVTGSEINKSAATGASSGMMVGLLPGLGGANAATLVLLLNKYISKSQESKNYGMSYILMTSAISTSDALFGIAALYLIDKSRSGASVAMDQLLVEGISITNLIWIISAMVLAGFIAKMILTKYGFVFSKVFSYLNNKSLSLSVIIFIVSLVYLTTGAWGIVILAGATFIGLIPPLVNVRRAQAMGFFMVPVLLFFSGFQREISSFLSIEAKVSPAIDLDLINLSLNIGISIVACIFVYILFHLIFRRINGIY